MKEDLILSQMQVGATFYMEGLDANCYPVFTKCKLVDIKGNGEYLVENGGILFSENGNEKVFLSNSLLHK